MNKEKSKVERFVERWFTDNGYKYHVIKQYVSKTVYEWTKDGITDKFEVPYDVTNPKAYMKLCRQLFEYRRIEQCCISGVKRY